MMTDASVKPQQAIGVVYLAWHGLGCDMFQQFAESYRRVPAGCEHDLIVIYAGFQSPEELSGAKAVFKDIPHIAVEANDLKLDIAYYLDVARSVKHDYLCFLNTYTKLAAPGWLAHLYKFASRSDVGIVGTTASYESLWDSFGMYQKAIWVCQQAGDRLSERAEYYLGFILRFNCPSAVIEPTDTAGLPRWKRRIVDYIKDREQEIGFSERWRELTAPNMVFADYSRFPKFPNPHVRSSGFMVERKRLLEFNADDIKTKYDACAFESGVNSLTANVRRAGLAAMVVTSDGQGYDVPDWVRSGTFRLGDGTRLLLTDNRSGEFHDMSLGERITHIRITWGDYLEPAPSDFTFHGYKYARGSLEPQPAPVIQPRPLASDPVYRFCKAVSWLSDFKGRLRKSIG